MHGFNPFYRPLGGVERAEALHRPPPPADEGSVAKNILATISRGSEGCESTTSGVDRKFLQHYRCIGPIVEIELGEGRLPVIPPLCSQPEGALDELFPIDFVAQPGQDASASRPPVGQSHTMIRMRPVPSTREGVHRAGRPVTPGTSPVRPRTRLRASPDYQV
jgi:hypothetical protein